MADESSKPQPSGNTPAPAKPPQPSPQPSARPLLGGSAASETGPASDAPPTFSPYKSPSEIVTGGLYVRKTKRIKGKPCGGEVVNGAGDVLATFGDEQENTGFPGDGDLTPKGEEFMKLYADELNVE